MARPRVPNRIPNLLGLGILLGAALALFWLNPTGVDQGHVLDRAIALFSAGASAPPVPPTPTVQAPTVQATTDYTYQIVDVYPHDRGAFTQGLLYADGFFYEGTGLWGQSSLRKVALESGEVLQIRELADEYFGEGLTLYGQELIQLTWQAGVGFVYDRDSFDLLDQFSYPTQGWGITHDGERLIMSDGSSNLYFWDPATFEEIGRVQVWDEAGPVTRLNELEYIEGQVYANVWQTDRIARIDPQSGQVTAWIYLRGLLAPEDHIPSVDVLNGIAYDGGNERLFVTGKRWPKLFEIDLIPLDRNAAWVQANDDGFGDPGNSAVSALEPYGSWLYAGTRNELLGSQIWRSADGLNWSVVVTAGLGYTHSAAIADLAGFGQHLYAGIEADAAHGAEIWRSPDGLEWTRVVSAGLGSPDDEAVVRLLVFSDTLYAGTRNAISGTGIWRSANGVDWQQDNAPGFGRAGNTAIRALAVFDDHFYAGTENPTAGAEIWRTDGLTWTAIVTAGLGISQNVALDSLAPFEGQLYALVHNAGGFQIWRSENGLHWTQVLSAGLRYRGNNPGGGLALFDGQLYLISQNPVAGAQVWRTGDGTTWEQVGFVGWGDRNNSGSHDDRSVATFGDRLFVGSVKSAPAGLGGELWLYLHHNVYLPLVGWPDE